MANAHLKFARPHVSIADTESHGKAFAQATPTRDTSAPRFRSLFVSSRGFITSSGSTIVTLAIMASLFVILITSLAFLGARVEEPYLAEILDHVAETSPGIVLLGESVDIDIEEPSVTVRWSIYGCGKAFMIPGSEGIHGSNQCGFLNVPVQIFVDRANEPSGIYDPSQILTMVSAHSLRIQKVAQFESDHTLDAHTEPMYPFDTYMLPISLRAVSPDNKTLSISKTATIDKAPSFDIATLDVESPPPMVNGTTNPIGDTNVSMHISRPQSARVVVMLLFIVTWILAHFTVAHVFMVRRIVEKQHFLKHLISSGAMLIVIPQLRNSMPDAPDLEGALIDCIGFFPQMIIASISFTVLLLLFSARELDRTGAQIFESSPMQPNPPVFRATQPRTFPASITASMARPPPSPTANSSPMEIAQYDMHRLMKHMDGQYVFPPLPSSRRIQTSSSVKLSHIQLKAMLPAMPTEPGEISYWSDSEEC